MKKFSSLYNLFFVAIFLFSINFLSAQQAIYDPLYPFHPPFSLNFISSDLPIVIINLDERMADKWEDRRVNADMTIIYHTDGSRNTVADTAAVNLSDSTIINYHGKVGIKYRGNSSYNSSDKKPFGMKTQDTDGNKLDANILGMGADSDWALLAPFNDRSMIRDVLTFDLCRGYLEYVPTGKYCEVVLNGVYQGVYIMCARVRRGPSRIDIPKPKTNSPDELSGGYILQIDRNDEPVFQSQHPYLDPLGYPKVGSHYFQYTYPDNDDYTDGMETQRTYIINKVRDFENMMASDSFDNPNTGYRKWLDVTSIIDYILAQEITHNVDGYRLSTYMYKYRDSHDPRFKFSIWDFNIAMGNADYCDGWSTEGWAWDLNRFEEPQQVPFWFHKLLNDEDFRMELRERWAHCRQGNFNTTNIIHKVDSLVQLLAEAEGRNTQIWNRWSTQLWPNYYISNSWNDEINYLKGWLTQRVAWIDSQLAPYTENLVANASFDTDPTRGPSSSSVLLSNWNQSYDVGLSSSVKLNGNYSLSFRNQGIAQQPITKISDGKYTFKAWVRTVGDPIGKVILRNFNDQQDPIVRNVMPSDSFYEIVIDDIEVNTGFCVISFRAEFTTGGTTRLYVDSVSFSRNRDENYTHHPENDVDLVEARLPILVISIPQAMSANTPASLSIINHSDSTPNRISDLKKPENITNPDIIPFMGDITISTVLDEQEMKYLTFFIKDTNGNFLDTSLLDLPVSNEWLLSPLHHDPSLIRAATYDLIAEEVDGYTRTGIFCNLVINDIYQGIYQLMIPIMNQLMLSDPGTSPENIRASYLLSTGNESGNSFRSQWKNRDLLQQIINDYTYYHIGYPVDNLDPAQKSYIQNRIYLFENMMTQNINHPSQGYRNYLDTNSLFNFILIQELFRNPEAYHSNLSLYNTVENPMFQFISIIPNHIIGNGARFESYATEGWSWNSNRLSETETVPFWIKNLLADNQFFNALRINWRQLRNQTFSDENIEAISESLLSPNLIADQPRHSKVFVAAQPATELYYQGDNWQDEINYFKNFLLQRAAWIDRQLLPDIPTNVVANHGFEVDEHEGLTAEMQLSSWDLNGEGDFSIESFESNYAFELQSSSSIYQTVTELLPGIYKFKFRTKGNGGELVLTIYHPEENIILRYTIPASSSYQEFEISNVEIDGFEIPNGICRIEIVNGSNAAPMLVDAVELYYTSPLGITDHGDNQKHRVTVYPNPFHTELIFEYLPQTEKQQITLYSMIGVCVASFEVGNAIGFPAIVRHSVSGSLPSGIYIYQIQDGSAFYTGKIVKR